MSEENRDVLMTEKQVMESLGLTNYDMRVWREAGLPFARIKKGLRVYLLSEIVSWAKKSMIRNQA